MKNLCSSLPLRLSPVSLLARGAGALLVVLSLTAAAFAAEAPDARIRLNTIGFLPEAPKRATIAAPCSEFKVVRDDGQIAHAGKIAGRVRTSRADTGETVYVADFTPLSEPGRYHLEVAGIGRSAPFEIGAQVWNTPFFAVARAFYLWRCGCAVDAEWNGQRFAHGPCHLDDARLDYVGGGSARKPGVGGWHDAGDYNKYVVNAGVTVGLLLKAWEQFRAPLTSVSLQIPESDNRVPDLLDEVRWEIEWLLTMQQEDGRVCHKLSSIDFSYWGPPEKDPGPRFFVPWSTTATADFVGMLAGAARAFRPYDHAFAARCETAARRSWEALRAHPHPVLPAQDAFKTGGYSADDHTHRMWAAAEWWETSGDPEALRDFETRAAKAKFTFDGPSWGNANDLALGTYLLASRSNDRDPRIVERLRKSLFKMAKKAVNTGEEHGYGRPYGGGRSSWWWGCNGTVAAQTYLLHVADRLQPDPRYRQTAQHSLAHLFGRNFHGRSYVTGLGFNPPQHPHDRRDEPAWPGNLVGGANPTGRDWEDVLANYRVNEIAINWNGSLAYALAAFVRVLEVEREGRSVAAAGSDLVAAEMNQPTTLRYTIANRGNAPLIVDRFRTLQVEQCAVEFAPVEKTTLAPNETVTLEVRVVPAAEDWSAEIGLIYNGVEDQPLRWRITKK